MQTIVRKDTNISLYYLNDDVNVTITDTETTLTESDGTPIMIIIDCTSADCTLHKNVEGVADWWGWKYKYDGTEWTLNTNFKGDNQLSAEIDDSVTTIPVLSARPYATAGGTVQIDNRDGTFEKITYTGIDGNNLTGCTRGAESTTANPHAMNEYVTQI
jgi:hypothetical protein